jgi:DNA-binding Xre family transcriptional regulator
LRILLLKGIVSHNQSEIKRRMPSMIVYDKLWVLLKEKNITQYKLNNMGISHSTLTRLKRNQVVNTDTISKLCSILQCDVGDIMEYVEDK